MLFELASVLQLLAAGLAARPQFSGALRFSHERSIAFSDTAVSQSLRKASSHPERSNQALQHSSTARVLHASAATAA